MKLQRFDVHAHYMLPDAVPSGSSAQNFISSPMPRWTPELALHFMERHGIATQMLSAPVPLNPADARAGNDYGARDSPHLPDDDELIGFQQSALPVAKK
jgi:hypothetical protein